MDRRSFVGGALAMATAACVPIDRTMPGRLAASLRLIEVQAGGTLGAELFDTGSGMAIGHNRDMRFGHCSSFKMSLAAMVLARDASGKIDADRRVTWTKDDLMAVSPFTTRRLKEGATLRELAEFTQKYSDNAAANILLRELGGPEALTAFWRSIGDEVSRLDRLEPALNDVPPGEARDTTTPRAMARTVAKLAFGEVLPETGRAQLRQWMIDTPTGVRRVRAGLPEDWIAGDKTGTSIWPFPDPRIGGLYVDIGFAIPPGKAPITFATYYRTPERKDGMDPRAEEVLAQVGRVLRDFAWISA